MEYSKAHIGKHHPPDLKVMSLREAFDHIGPGWAAHYDKAFETEYLRAYLKT